MSDMKFGDDSFWDLDKKYIKKNAPSPSPYTKSSVEAVEITSDGYDSISLPIPVKKLPQKSSSATVYEYKPDNIFINKVRITTQDANGNIFNLSNLFMRERAALIDRKGVECPHVSFYSYAPRYSQMTKAQLAYYLWWRENARHSNYIKTDISYIKLYVTELVTSLDGEDVTDALYKLCQMSKLCFDNPVGKIYMGRVISDFCLLHGLSCPIPLLEGVFPSLIAEHICDEFFLALNEQTRHSYSHLALSYISVYNYKKSKFYEQYKDSFDKYIPNAISHIFKTDSSYSKITSLASGIFSTSLTDRKLFDGRPEFCAQGARLLVSYYPVSCITSIVTNAVRYAENKLRECMNIRTRLAISELDGDVSKVIDSYFESVASDFVKPKQKEAQFRVTKKVKAEEYDKLYDLPKAPLSLERAAEIEKSSWATTYKLTEAFEDNCAHINESDIAPILQASITDTQKNTAEKPKETNKELKVSDTKQDDTKQDGNPFGSLYPFILICKSGYTKNQKTFAKDNNMTVDEVADRINEIAVDIYGDIILENIGDGYEIIQDYADLII